MGILYEKEYGRSVSSEEARWLQVVGNTPPRLLDLLKRNQQAAGVAALDPVRRVGPPLQDPVDIARMRTLLDNVVEPTDDEPMDAGEEEDEDGENEESEELEERRADSLIFP